jgi:hypothetical protein
MRSRILRTETELEQFAGEFQARGNAVSLEYLRQSQVRAFFSGKGKMVAGYVRNTERPLRYEGWIPEEYRSGIPLLSSGRKLCELTCIWIAGREGKISSEKVYLYSVIDAILSGADYVLGGTLSAVVFGIQTQSLPDLLYSGTTEYFGTPRQCWVYCASRGALIGKLMTVFPYNMVMSALGKPVYLNRARSRARRIRVPSVN